jgi:hypothetical protein
MNHCQADVKKLFPYVFSFFLLLSFLHLLTCVYIVCATSLPTSRQNLFHPLWFCWRENIRDNKKDIVFFLVCDKDSYRERFCNASALLPCTCVLQPTLVRFYPNSLLLPGPLPIVASVSLRLLYSRLNREKHQPHSSFPFLISSVCVFSP